MDYRLEVKVKNNRILQHIEDNGYKNVGEFCRMNPVVAKDQSRIGDLVNMKASPLNSEGDFAPIVYRLCEALVCSPEDLFTHEQMMAELQSNKRVIKVNEAQVQFMLNNQAEPMLLEDSISIEQRNKELKDMVSSLTPREAKIINMRFGLEGEEPMTLHEIAKIFDVTGQRIRDIEGKALRKMRHPTRHAKIREMMEA